MIVDLKPDLFSIPAAAAGILYPSVDTRHVQAQLWDYIRGVGEIDDLSDDPYPELAQILAASLSANYNAVCRMHRTTYVHVLARVGWKVHMAEKRAIAARRVMHCGTEGLMWAMIITGSGEFRADTWGMDFAIPILLGSVLHAPISVAFLSLMEKMAEILSFTCGPVSWIHALVLHRSVQNRRGAPQDLNALLSGRCGQGHNVRELAQRCPLDLSMDELADEYEELLEAFPEGSPRQDTLDYIRTVFRVVNDQAGRDRHRS